MDNIFERFFFFFFGQSLELEKEGTYKGPNPLTCSLWKQKTSPQKPEPPKGVLEDPKLKSCQIPFFGSALAYTGRWIGQFGSWSGVRILLLGWWSASYALLHLSEAGLLRLMWLNNLRLPLCNGRNFPANLHSSIAHNEEGIKKVLDY